MFGAPSGGTARPGQLGSDPAIVRPIRPPKSAYGAVDSSPTPRI